MISKREKAVVREVIHAEQMHLDSLRKKRERNATASRIELDDIIEGMAISIDKLERLIGG
jgi:hypothetical protein